MTYPDSDLPIVGPEENRLGRTVLVVDDIDVVRRVVFAYLSEAAYRVYVAEGAAEAFEVLDERAIDLVLLDVVMPGVNGVELARRIGERWPTQRFLFMSSYSDMVLLEHGLKPWDHKVLVKPFTGPQLVAAVEQALGAQPYSEHPPGAPGEGPTA